MKRSAAVVGPTPQFVRWAIVKPCPFREIELDDLANSTFRQLRSLREYSKGMRDNRVFEGICVHETVKATASPRIQTEARGFPIEEVLALFGDTEYIHSVCDQCPANSADGSGKAWAGCFGWLPENPEWNIGPRRRIESNWNGGDLMILVTRSIKKLEHDFVNSFPSSPPNWYGLWMPRVLSQAQIDLLERVFWDVSQTGPSFLVESDCFNMLVDAIHRCRENDLQMHVELVPPGHSDGVRWEIFAHCPECLCVASAPIGESCPGCGSAQKPVRARFQKVLGYRPYLMLKNILGSKETVDFVKRYLLKSS